jgi:hypothetical protein
LLRGPFSSRNVKDPKLSDSVTNFDVLPKIAPRRGLGVFKQHAITFFHNLVMEDSTLSFNFPQNN